MTRPSKFWTLSPPATTQTLNEGKVPGNVYSSEMEGCSGFTPVTGCERSAGVLPKSLTVSQGGLWFDSCIFDSADEDDSLRSMAKLVAVTQELAGLSHELNGGWTTIGRADGNAFKIPAASVSNCHCEVRQQGGELLVRDLCSTNGTFVQGKKVTEAVLK